MDVHHNLVLLPQVGVKRMVAFHLALNAMLSRQDSSQDATGDLTGMCDPQANFLVSCQTLTMSHYDHILSVIGNC